MYLVEQGLWLSLLNNNMFYLLSGGVVIYFDRIEVVNLLSADHGSF